ncbi:unnamed protein product [Closterium sp. NIES-65]|nr:unnamed protein product [Closterium sp. NIES-65]
MEALTSSLLSTPPPTHRNKPSIAKLNRSSALPGSLPHGPRPTFPPSLKSPSPLAGGPKCWSRVPALPQGSADDARAAERSYDEVEEAIRRISDEQDQLRARVVEASEAACNADVDVVRPVLGSASSQPPQAEAPSAMDVRSAGASWSSFPSPEPNSTSSASRRSRGRVRAPPSASQAPRLLGAPTAPSAAARPGPAPAQGAAPSLSATLLSLSRLSRAETSGTKRMVAMVAAWDAIASRLPPSADGGAGAPGSAAGGGGVQTVLAALRLALMAQQQQEERGRGKAGQVWRRETVRVANEESGSGGDGRDAFTRGVAVAAILADLRMEPDVIAAGLLSDPVQRGHVTLPLVHAHVSPAVARLLHDCARLHRLPKRVRALDDDTAAAARQFALAFHDPRAVVLQIAAKLDAMQHLSAPLAPPSPPLSPSASTSPAPSPAPPPKATPRQQTEALEAIQVWAPLAHTLGIGALTWQMEDAALRHLFPRSYMSIQAWVAAQWPGGGERLVGEVRRRVEEVLAGDAQLRGAVGGWVVSGRVKSMWSVMKKVLRDGRPRTRVNDLFGLRIVISPRARAGGVEGENAREAGGARGAAGEGSPLGEGEAAEACYRVRELLLQEWREDAARMKDYIARPKGNGYQSLHMALKLPFRGALAEEEAEARRGEEGEGGGEGEERVVEVQIRTARMEEEAVRGGAAHGLYKGGSRVSQDQVRSFYTAMVFQSACLCSPPLTLHPSKLLSFVLSFLRLSLPSHSPPRPPSPLLPRLPHALSPLPLRGAQMQQLKGVMELLAAAAAGSRADLGLGPRFPMAQLAQGAALDADVAADVSDAVAAAAGVGRERPSWSRGGESEEVGRSEWDAVRLRELEGRQGDGELEQGSKGQESTGKANQDTEVKQGGGKGQEEDEKKEAEENKENEEEEEEEEDHDHFFAMLDLNGDGVISVEEMSQFMQQLGAGDDISQLSGMASPAGGDGEGGAGGREAAEELVALLDANMDGSICAKEFAAFRRQVRALHSLREADRQSQEQTSQALLSKPFAPARTTAALDSSSSSSSTTGRDGRGRDGWDSRAMGVTGERFEGGGGGGWGEGSDEEREDVEGRSNSSGSSPVDGASKAGAEGNISDSPDSPESPATPPSSWDDSVDSDWEVVVPSRSPSPSPPASPTAQYFDSFQAPWPEGNADGAGEEEVLGGDRRGAGKQGNLVRLSLVRPDGAGRGGTAGGQQQRGAERGGDGSRGRQGGVGQARGRARLQGRQVRVQGGVMKSTWGEGGGVGKVGRVRMVQVTRWGQRDAGEWLRWGTGKQAGGWEGEWEREGEGKGPGALEEGEGEEEMAAVEGVLKVVRRHMASRSGAGLTAARNMMDESDSTASPLSPPSSLSSHSSSSHCHSHPPPLPACAMFPLCRSPCGQLLACHPSNANVLVHMAQLERHAGNTGAARQWYERSAHCFEARGHLGRQYVRALQAWGMLEALDGRIAASRRLFEHSLQVAWKAERRSGQQQVGAVVVGLHAWAMVERRVGNFTAARHLLQRAERVEPGNAVVLQARALLEAAVGHLSAARHFFKRAAAADPADAACWQCSDSPPSLVHFSFLLSAFSFSVSVYHCPAVNMFGGAGGVVWQAWAVTEARAGRVDRMRDLFTAALSVHPSSLPTLHAWACEEARLGSAQPQSLQRARDLFTRCLNVDPECSYALQSWAVMEQRAGNVAQARTLFDRCLQIAPSSVPALQAYAVMERKQGNALKARALLALALSLQPNNAAVLQVAAELEQQLGNEAAAQALYVRTNRADRSAARRRRRMFESYRDMRREVQGAEEAREWMLKRQAKRLRRKLRQKQQRKQEQQQQQQSEQHAVVLEQAGDGGDAESSHEQWR